ncbi:MAG: polysaccharide biosynthesis/export family protein [Vicinamibacteria bacterium]|nr:polysaccharide biosynthesis/export family protein [Vicinamibacteria bacterium]
MRAAFLIAILLVFGGFAPSAGQDASGAEIAADVAAVAADDYLVGVGDVLEITVLTHEDLSRSATVQTNGAISLPLLGEVEVAGLGVAGIKDKLAALLEKDFLFNPQVEVRVREYRSQFVTVIGEVGKPGRKALRGRTRVVDILVESGGFTERASGEVMLARSDGAFADGSTLLRFRLGGTVMTPEEQLYLEIVLRGGDILTASPKYYVIVEGEVNRPNRYGLDRELTVMGAVSLAGGLTRFGSNDVKVVRVDPATGERQILDVDLKAIRKGKKPDPRLQPNDVVSVPRRLF